MNSPAKHALIIGATGAFGSAITEVMANKGWRVSALRRKTNANSVASNTNIDYLTGDLDNPDWLMQAVRDVDLIVHAVNVPYPKWDPVMVNYTRTIIQLAQQEQAHLIFIGNVYNLGIPDNGLIHSDSPDAPVNEKGELRSTLETMIIEACANGLCATTMRFGDFFGPGITKNNWFHESTKKVQKNRLVVPGPMDVPHTWAYLPDAALATERVATVRLQHRGLPNYMVLPFHGHVFTFADLKKTLETIKGHPLKVTGVPWKLFKLLAVGWPLMKDIVSMRYLWQHDIQMDGSTLRELIGEPVHTSLQEAICEATPGVHNDE